MITVCCAIIVMFRSVKFRKQLYDISTRKSRDIISHYMLCFIVAGYSRTRFSYLIGNQPLRSGMVDKELRCASTTTVSVAMGRLFTVPQDLPDQEPSVSGLHFDFNFHQFSSCQEGLRINK